MLLSRFVALTNRVSPLAARKGAAEMRLGGGSLASVSA